MDVLSPTNCLSHCSFCTLLSETGNTVCGGCLTGSYVGDNYDGTRDEDYYTNSASVTITVDVTAIIDCQDSACVQSVYNQIINDITSEFENDSFALGLYILTCSNNGYAGPRLFRFRTIDKRDCVLVASSCAPYP